MKDFVVVVSYKSELEAVLGGIDGDCLGFCRAIKAVDSLAFDSGKVHWLIKSLDDAIVAVQRLSTGFVSVYRQTYP